MSRTFNEATRVQMAAMVHLCRLGYQFYGKMHLSSEGDKYDGQTKQKVVALIKTSLNEDLPESYDKPAFDDKTTLLLNHFIDMAVQGYGWLAA